ncbi:hypothetical protein QOZ80_4BG0353560 [Eleusine coracana subsp. coracana]|nr:hypothetical protein QOZ80_4BG0353560 [Eleusine coracana subsp. coracana]
MAQVKQKEQDIKKDYRVMKDLSGESGFGWDPDRKMVTSVDSVWESLESRRNKDALLRWRDKSFPYYDDLFALYDERYAQGRSCRGMDHFASASYLNFDVGEGPGRDDINWFGSDAFSPFPNIVAASMCPQSNDETLVPEQRPQETQRLNPLPSSSTPNVTDGKRPKKQKTSTNASTDNFHEKFLILKKEEIDRFAAIEEKKMEDPYSIKNCVTMLEGLADRLQVEDVLKEADIFKDNTANREVFLSFRSDELRLGWLLKQL